MKTVILLLILLLGTTQAEAQLSTLLGWQEIPNTKIRPNCPSEAQFPGITGGQGCDAVTSNWSGAAIDTLRNKMYITGGGHTGYNGNEIYTLDLTTFVMTRSHGPSPGPYGTGTSDPLCFVLSDGQPAATHTYDHLAYDPSRDIVYRYGGGAAPCAGLPNVTLRLNPTTQLWSNDNRTLGSGSQNPFEVGPVYDAVNQRIWVRDDHFLYDYNPSTSTYTVHGADEGVAGYKTSWLDTKRRRYYMLVTEGSGGSRIGLHYYELSGSDSYAMHNVSYTASGTDPSSINNISCTYDPVRDRAVCWLNGNTYYEFNPITLTFNPVTTTGAPAGVFSGSYIGAYNRFTYVRSLGGIISVNDIDDNAFFLRLSPPEDVDFYNRCHGAGVIVCNGFDSAADFGSYQTTRPNTGPFCSGAVPSCTSIVRDTTQYASCSNSSCGSVHWLIRGSGDSFGNYEFYYGTSSGLETKEGQTIYFQWKGRRGTLANLGGGGDKSFTLYDYRTQSCATLELTQTNWQYRSLPYFYSECGGRALEYNDGVDVVVNWSTAYPPGGTFPAVDPNFYCRYNSGNEGSLPNNKCPFYELTTWRTFYCEITVGTWGGANSTVKCGQWNTGDAGYRWYVNRTNYVLNKDAGAVGFNTLSFPMFMTGRGVGTDADMWMDEAIISTQPIPYPGAPAAAVVVLPSKPTQIKVTGM